MNDNQDNAALTSRRKFMRGTVMAGGAAVAAPLLLNSQSASAGDSLNELFNHGGGRHGRGPSRVEPNDVRYPSLLSGSNSRFVSTPAWVSICDSSAEVYKAAHSALKSGKRITVRSGGHCYENFYQNDGGAIIDVSNMRDVYKRGDYYIAEAGASLGLLYEHLFKEHGVTLPGGSCLTVGMGGHICGGGFGILSRRHGLTVDYLEGVEIVTFDRRNGMPSRPKVYLKSHGGRAADIVWAHQGGGGGNFGIVTKYIFKALPAAPDYIHWQQLPIAWDSLNYSDFSQLLTAFGNFFVDNDYPESPYNGLHASISVSPRSGGAGNLSLSVFYSGDNPSLIHDFYSALSLPALFNSVDNDPSSAAAAIGYISTPFWSAIQQFGGGGGSIRAKYKSAYMNTSFPAEQIDTIWNMLNSDQYYNPYASLQISSYGGQINAVSDDSTAAAHRHSIMKLQYQTYWFEPVQDEYHMGFMRNFYDAMYGMAGPISDGVMDGCYVNYPDRDLADNWPALYYKDNYAKLQRIKTMLDPSNQLHHDQSVAPLPVDDDNGRRWGKGNA